MVILVLYGKLYTNLLDFDALLKMQETLSEIDLSGKLNSKNKLKSKGSISDRLTRLNHLKEAGLISDKEFYEKRKTILDSL